MNLKEYVNLIDTQIKSDPTLANNEKRKVWKLYNDLAFELMKEKLGIKSRPVWTKLLDRGISYTWPIHIYNKEVIVPYTVLPTLADLGIEIPYYALALTRARRLGEQDNPISFLNKSDRV